jgi:hypothetical protein
MERLDQPPKSPYEDNYYQNFGMTAEQEIRSDAAMMIATLYQGQQTPDGNILRDEIVSMANYIRTGEW